MSNVISPSEASNRRSFIHWTGASLTVIVALMLLAVHAPPAMKLIGLFTLGYGCLAGWLLGRGARRMRVSWIWPATITAGFLIAGGVAGIAWDSHRLWKQAQASSEADFSNRILLSWMSEHPAPEAPEQNGMWQEFRRGVEDAQRAHSERTSFPTYFSRRLGQKEVRSWAVAVWFGELILASVAGGWIVYRTLYSPATDHGPRTTDPQP